MREWVLNLSRTTSIRLRRNKGQSGNSCPGRPGASFFFRKEASVAWIYLIAAGILETLWAVAMKASNGFTLLIPSDWLSRAPCACHEDAAARHGICRLDGDRRCRCVCGGRRYVRRITLTHAGDCSRLHCCRPDHDEGLGVKNGGCPLQAQARYPAGVVVPHRCCGS